MAIKKFLTSVADVYGYDVENSTLIFTAKTLLDSSVEVSLGSAPVRGGKGNQLQYVYYHTGEMKITLTDAQWNLALLGSTVGSDAVTGEDVYTEENVQVTVSTNTVTASVSGTPKVWGTDTTIYGWATLPNGNIIKGTFTGQAFTATKASSDTLVTNDWVCLRYYHADAAATSYKVKANMIPKIVRLVMEAQLNSGDVSSNQIGTVQIIIPTATLSGAFTVSMKADGVSNTPLSASALAYNGDLGGNDICTDEPYYAKIVEIISSANWYDKVVALAIQGGDFSMADDGEVTLVVWAVPSSGAAFIPPVADLTFSVDAETYVGIGENTGVVSGHTAGTGDTLITVIITDAATIEASCTVSTDL